MKRLFVVLGIIVVLLVVLAFNNPDICFADTCKHVNAECTVNDSRKACCPGLTCTPFNENSGNGKCNGNEIEPCVSTGFPACIETCGYAGGEIKDNCGNSKTCPSTGACPCVPDNIMVCPSECGFPGGTIVNSCGTEVTCPATKVCDESCVSTGFPACPDSCGFPGGVVYDNCGNASPQCASTEACVEPCVSTGFPVCEDDCGFLGGVVVDNCGNKAQCNATEVCAVVTVDPPARKIVVTGK